MRERATGGWRRWWGVRRVGWGRGRAAAPSDPAGQAGARNLIMTLWSIPDAQVTPQMVREIYSGIFRGESPAQALAETQKKWMNTLRETQGLHAAVKKAGAFIVISQGPAYVKDTK